jgi:hypothetical protein
LLAELQRSRRAGHDYDVLAKLPQLRAALEAAPSIDGSAGEHGPEADASPFGHSAHLAPATWKLVVLAAAVGVSAFVAWPARRSQPTSPRSQAGEATPAAPAITPPLVAQQPAPAAAPESAVPEAAAPAADAAAARPAPSAQPAANSSRREIAQLVRIRAMLEQNPAAAYRLAVRSEREFPHGVLSEERQALQMLALARSGSTRAAEQKARAFFARYPQSPMRQLLEDALRR